MSNVPPEEPMTPPPPPAATATRASAAPRRPARSCRCPGNAELAIYLFATIVLAIIWAASDRFDAGGFAGLFTWLTIGYILSRGVAKASRVLEQ